ncbi:uncharacterized protein LOC111080260 [Drosophila obscura]|uniref:uncharacterized protein LOC111080260 n=1 Tax=Drosophila obscura TaxID=7282 RepID=UPI001BB2975A|nr:uncharacterized protein LOC111080260 [Drosophila obscura]XP_022231443.2 uncharacterized protein LOC111080260 [Drosophila obscura]XP_022231444.2 uncharacterized protein LOC111080260 [Drosophila obscura]
MQQPAQNMERSERWVRFLEQYSQLPQLWDFESSEYKDQRCKAAAYASLLEVYHEIDAEATVDAMRRKINSMRTCYRRELRRVKESKKWALKPEDIHVPQLWYFDALNFLHDKVGLRARRRSRSKDDTDWEEEDDHELDTHPTPNTHDDRQHSIVKLEPYVKMELCSSPPTQSSSQTALKRARSVSRELAPPSDARHSRDEAAIYAEGWAVAYRKMNEGQRLLAKKAIEEVLILGQLNKLQFNAVKMPPRED